MPPPRRQPQEEESDGSEEDYGNAVDFTRFTNPNYAREFKAKLPEKIRDRVKALEALDEDYKALRLEMQKAMEAAEKEFQDDIQPQIAARNKILSGEVEPTDDEVAAGVPEDLKDSIQLTGTAGASKGIPDFWLDALQHHVIIREFITERDEEALRFLEDISCTPLEAPAEGYTVTFRFAENPFFTNTTLSKSFTLSRQQDDIVLSKSTGTKVGWKEGKNLGVRTVTKKMKNKAKKGQFKFVTAEEPCETFFHFFSDEEGQDGADEEWMALADTLKEKIIPFAVEYFTGEAPNGESDMEDEDYDDEEEEEEEEEEEPAPVARGRGGYQAPGGKRGGAGRGGQQDCKQQ